MDIHYIDITIFVVYLFFMLGVGFYFMRKNNSEEDYYVGSRNMSAGHVGLSVVATDVGGGFSIGLGGLGFAIGLSGSWMLFTGLLGAWISAVLLIPKIYPLSKKHSLLTFPQALSHRYNPKVALVAGIICLIGYIGFTSSQILAGAKLATATFPSLSLNTMAVIMGVIAVVYTVIGGIKAVIYTDTIQWIILMAGLFLIGIPVAYTKIGGWEALEKYLPEQHLGLSNLSFVQVFNWMITILPIWFVGMTLYQRIYACKDAKTAQKAWRIAGLLEWPVMAFMGVILGLFSRVAFEQGAFIALGYAPSGSIDAELGLPLLLRNTLPVGLMGLMMAAYFSAIMSTADSCLMAASGNLMTDVIGFFKKNKTGKKRGNIVLSQLLTLVIGALAILIAIRAEDVLELMLYSYAFMVSGLIVPVVGMLVLKKPSSKAAIVAMMSGGFTTMFLILNKTPLPYGLDANFFGILASTISFLMINKVKKND